MSKFDSDVTEELYGIVIEGTEATFGSVEDTGVVWDFIEVLEGESEVVSAGYYALITDDQGFVMSVQFDDAKEYQASIEKVAKMVEDFYNLTEA